MSISDIFILGGIILSSYLYGIYMLIYLRSSSKMVTIVLDGVPIGCWVAGWVDTISTVKLWDPSKRVSLVMLK